MPHLNSLYFQPEESANKEYDFGNIRVDKVQINDESEPYADSEDDYIPFELSDSTNSSAVCNESEHEDLNSDIDDNTGYVTSSANPTFHNWGPCENDPNDFGFSGQSGLKLSDMDLSSPYAIFRQFITDEILDIMVQETNRYASEYIRTHQLRPRSFVSKWTGTNRDNADPAAKTDRLHKIKNLLNLICQQFQDTLSPGESVVIGETMVPWRGSVQLCNVLLKAKTYLCGTLRSNRRGNPVGVTKMVLKKGEIYGEQNNVGIRVMKWVDKRPVLMISSVPSHKPELTEKKIKGEDVMKPQQLLLTIKRKKTLMSQIKCHHITRPLGKASSGTKRELIKLTENNYEAQEKGEDDELVPAPKELTLKTLNKCFTKAHDLIELLIREDPTMERSLKSKREVFAALAPYKEIEKNLRNEAKQSKITSYLSKN
ncbi:unnamed protein product [Acanthoscelides obtectus]|uniref:PiggyBac transposable element-derived protein domain-containing protein n=1 Tax=Acanthoscelides obtectus TaxID=200917 RepID=A0A9P0M0M0_ACAOB|nr:unnamed protein product [Acanthoscelides obtectus]CAK1651551.1 hypothetical protein AOBTE_LOCUS17341 [Acanthoscelides obtectus]